MKKIKKTIIALLLPILCFSNILNTHAAAQTELSKVTDCTSHAIQSNETVGWPEGPQVAAESAIIMEASTGAILYEKNIQDVHYPASITKIMTTMIAIENSSLDDVVTFSRDSVYGIERASSHIGIDVGEQLTMEQCLYGIMLASANEVSYAVAEHVGGSLDSFIDMMNERAKELGCSNTHFSNANGLPDETHYTTAYDMALITKAALQLDTFRTISKTQRYTIPPTNLQPESRYFENHHKMLRKTSYYYEGCEGGKTGYTSVALNTLVTFAKRGDMELICVTMKTQGTQVYTDTALLLDYGFNNFHMENVSENEKNFTLGNSSFFNSQSTIFENANTPVSLNGSGCIVLPNSAAFNDAAPALVFDKTGSSDSVARLSYSFSERYIGGTDIELLKADIHEFKFGKSTSATETDEPVAIKKNFIKINVKILFGIIMVVAAVYTYFRIFLLRRRYFSYMGKRSTKKRKSSRRTGSGSRSSYNSRY